MWVVAAQDVEGGTIRAQGPPVEIRASLCVYIYMGVPKNWGTLFWDPYSKDPTTYLG